MDLPNPGIKLLNRRWILYQLNYQGSKKGIVSGKLPHSTGSSSRCSVRSNWGETGEVGGSRERGCMSMDSSFPDDSDGKESACNVGDLCSIPGLGRSPGEGNDNPLQYSCLENSMDRGTWQATVHGFAKSQT